MSDNERKNQIPSVLKCTYLMVIAAVIFYNVYPKYTYISSSCLRLNKITGEMCEIIDIDEKGIFIFKK